MSRTKEEFYDQLQPQTDANIQPIGMRISYNNKGEIMALNIPEISGGDYKTLAPNMYIGRCIRVVDIGTQVFEYNGEAKAQHKIMLIFELPTEQIQDKNGAMMPMLQSKEYSLSMHEKSNLRKDLQNWRGRNFSDEEAVTFELKKLVSVPCGIAIVHKNSNGKTYANISSIVPVMKGMECPAQVHEGFFYEIEEGHSENYNKLPEWIQKKIDSAIENNTTQSTPESEYNQVDESMPKVDVPF